MAEESRAQRSKIIQLSSLSIARNGRHYTGRITWDGAVRAHQGGVLGCGHDKSSFNFDRELLTQSTALLSALPALLQPSVALARHALPMAQASDVHTDITSKEESDKMIDEPNIIDWHASLRQSKTLTNSSSRLRA